MQHSAYALSLHRLHGRTYQRGDRSGIRTKCSSLKTAVAVVRHNLRYRSKIHIDSIACKCFCYHTICLRCLIRSRNLRRFLRVRNPKICIRSALSRHCKKQWIFTKAFCICQHLLKLLSGLKIFCRIYKPSNRLLDNRILRAFTRLNHCLHTCQRLGCHKKHARYHLFNGHLLQKRINQLA